MIAATLVFAKNGEATQSRVILESFQPVGNFLYPKTKALRLFESGSRGQYSRNVDKMCNIRILPYFVRLVLCSCKRVEECIGMPARWS
eukprot:3807331-Amphidinium_carterae.2